MKQMLTGNSAAAWGARLADVDYLPAFPITPQTEIIETLAHWAAQGEIPARFVSLHSEHSMLTAAGAAAAAGARVFTATSSQGLLPNSDSDHPRHPQDLGRDGAGPEGPLRNLARPPPGLSRHGLAALSR